MAAEKLKPNLEKQLAELLAQSNNKNLEVFALNNVKISPSEIGFLLEFSHSPGEAIENCKAQYRKTGTLKYLDCDLEYISSSKGQEEQNIKMSSHRYFNTSGILEKISGKVTVSNLSDKKVVTDRKINSKSDEALEHLAKPLLKLPDDLMLLVK